MVELQKDIESINAANIQVVGISYDSVEILANFTAKRKITFPLLSDPESKVIKAYGVLNPKASGRQAGIPNPGTFLIDRHGIIRAHIPGTVRERHSIEELINAAKGNPPAKANS